MNADSEFKAADNTTAVAYASIMTGQFPRPTNLDGFHFLKRRVCLPSHLDFWRTISDSDLGLFLCTGVRMLLAKTRFFVNFVLYQMLRLILFLLKGWQLLLFDCRPRME